MEEGQRREYSDLAPGLTQVIDAGDELVMRDNDGNEFSVKATEHPKTLEFCQAFDEWLTLKKGGKVNASILQALWQAVEKAFNNLPSHVTRELPSIKHAGVIVPRHDHG